jgi:hypothetical protein
LPPEVAKQVWNCIQAPAPATQETPHAS